MIGCMNPKRSRVVLIIQTKTTYEEKILKEVQGLSEPLQKKLLKFVQFLKQEIIKPEYDEKSATDEFLSTCGTWEDDRSADDQIHDIYSNRKSTDRAGNIFL